MNTRCSLTCIAGHCIEVTFNLTWTEALVSLCSILTRMRVVISEGVLEKRTALLIQNFLEQVHTRVPGFTL